MECKNKAHVDVSRAKRVIARRVTKMITECHQEPINSISKLVKMFLNLGYINTDQRGGLVEQAWTYLQ